MSYWRNNSIHFKRNNSERRNWMKTISILVVEHVEAGTGQIKNCLEAQPEEEPLYRTA